MICRNCTKKHCGEDGRYGFRLEGLGALEQFFMARLTAYRSVVYNKHALSFDLMAQDVYRAMIALGLVHAPDSIFEMLRTDDWLGFNDHYVFERMLQFVAKEGANPADRAKARGIIEGKPMLIVEARERFCTEGEWQDALSAPPHLPRIPAQLEEFTIAAGVDAGALMYVEDGVSVVERNDRVPVLIRRRPGDEFINILETEESYLRLLEGRKWRFLRLYALNEETKQRAQEHLHRGRA